MELGRGARLLLETLDLLLVLTELPMDDLEGDDPVHLEMSGLKDHPHATATHKLQNLVATAPDLTE